MVLGGIASNHVIARSEFEVQIIWSKNNAGCDWCIYVTMVTCVDTSGARCSSVVRALSYFSFQPVVCVILSVGWCI